MAGRPTGTAGVEPVAALSEQVTYAALQAGARARHLDIFGGFHPRPDAGAPEGTGTLLMLGPFEPGFWNGFTSSPEYRDHRPDPLDRWSKRVIGGWAEQIGARALFPSDGPPYPPFVAWALETGRAWMSPVTLLVHDRAGLMLSFRGALAVPERIVLPATGPRPCDTCPNKPCLSACPANALTTAGYDLPACHEFLDTPAGGNCLFTGCAVRRACPVAQSYGRLDEQSAFHMKAFHPR